MSLRMGIRPLLVCSAVLAVATGAFAQKVAIINLQQAVFETAEIKQANVEMTAKYKARDDELEQLTIGLAGAVLPGIAEKLVQHPLRRTRVPVARRGLTVQPFLFFFRGAHASSSDCGVVLQEQCPVEYR